MSRNIILGTISEISAGRSQVDPHLDRDGNAMQWSPNLASRSLLVEESSSLFKQVDRGRLDHGMELFIMALDLGDILSNKIQTCHTAAFQETLEVFGINFQ